MVSWGLLAKTVNANQSIVSVKPESIEPIELLYGALWVAPPCYQDGGHSAPPRSLPACGADRRCLVMDGKTEAIKIVAREVGEKAFGIVRQKLVRPTQEGR